MTNFLKRFNKYLLKLVYPNGIKCIFCGDELDNNSYNFCCANCLKTLPFIKACCIRCGNPMNENSDAVCFSCKTNNYNFVNAFSVFEYRDEILNVIHKFKYNSGKYLYKPLSKFMLDYYVTKNLKVDCVTYIPMFNKKEKSRGYNQAKLLAEEFAKSVKLPVYSFCKKIKDNTSQTSLDFKLRYKNVMDSFQFDKSLKNEIKGKKVLIIDDIFTTGATANELCKVLIKHGASECYVFTLAHTPLKNKELNNI